MNQEKYWIGPFEILVSNDIGEVVDEDGYNSMYSDGSSTEQLMMDSPEMNETIYKHIYAKFNESDQQWYHTGNTKSYWIGPYGVLVPGNINGVVATDGHNIMHKSGSSTERGMIGGEKMTETKYKELYATFNQTDEKYYYNA